MSHLEKELFRDMLEIYDRASKECNYRPQRYRQKVCNSKNIINTAIELVVKENETEGFMTLVMCSRLDLTLEYLLISDKYSGLFSNEIIHICTERLNKYSV